MSPGAGGAFPPEQPSSLAHELDDRIVLLLHRLRTPLTTMKGWAEMAERQAQPGVAATHVLPHLHQIVEAIRGMETEIDALAAEADTRLAGLGQAASAPDTSESDSTCPESGTPAFPPPE